MGAVARGSSGTEDVGVHYSTAEKSVVVGFRGLLASPT